MPTILTEENAQSEITGSDQGAATPAPPPATPTVTINTVPPAKTSHWKRNTAIVFAAIALVAGIHNYMHPKNQTRQQQQYTAQIQQKKAAYTKPKKQLITYYGTLNNDVIIGEKHEYALWGLGKTVQNFALVAANSNGVTVRGPNGRLFHRPWWKPPKTKPHHHKHATSIKKILH